MSTVEDYVARIEETCGEEKNYVVIFKYDLKNQAIAKILKKAKVEKSISLFLPGSIANLILSIKLRPSIKSMVFINNQFLNK